MKNWNFGIIGAGTIADFHARAIRDLPNAQLIGFCDVVASRAVQMAEKYQCRVFKDYQQMVKSADIDIVSIATPSGLHMAPAIAAAEAGKHVICEKPIEIVTERIDKMIEAHKRAGTVLGAIFQNRFNPAVGHLKKAVIEGRFGTITYAGAFVPWWRSDEYYQTSWRGTWELDGGGAMMNQSIHVIDLLCYLMPPIMSLNAYTGKLGHPQIETEDTAVVSMEFIGGPLGIVYGTTASFPGQPKRIEISGTKGTAVLIEDSLAVWQFTHEVPEDELIRKEFFKSSGIGGAADPANFPYKYHTMNFKAFLEAIDKKQNFYLNGQEARKSVEIILAIYKSAKEKQRIRF